MSNETQELYNIINSIVDKKFNTSNLVTPVKSATVISYNSSTGYAVVNFPSDTTNVSLINLSGQNLNTGDIVEVTIKGNNMTNAYISANRNNTSVCTGASGTFTTANGKTVTVVNGLITSIE
jgi:hypothetical protein